jgi:hypothetical protein
LALDKEYSLPSVNQLTLGKAVFTECLFWTLGKEYFYFFILPTKLFVLCSYTIESSLVSFGVWMTTQLKD